MTSKHITRDYSAHKKSVVRPYDEYCRFEIFSYDPNYTKSFLRDNIRTYSNAVKSSYRSWACFIADNMNDMIFTIPYHVSVKGEYRIDVIYEQSNHIYSDKSKNTGSDLLGGLEINRGESTIYDKDILFDGENNILKRITHFQELDLGNYDIVLNVPHNCYFYGVIIRKIIKYTGTNAFGEDSNDTGDMMVTSVSLSISDMVKPSELQVEVGYDDRFECYDSPSGFYIDYMDEANYYVKDNDGVIRRVFGGYVSSILPNDDKTKLTIHCADRLVDGQNKYILDLMKMQGGTSSDDTDKYEDGMTKDFTTYGQALKYLCDIHEVTLKSNISKNYLVDGEKYSKGLQITYGKNKTIKTVQVSNGYSTPSNNFIELRNKPSGSKIQTWTLYDASKVTKTPPALYQREKSNGVSNANYGYMHITYGLGSPKTSVQSKTTQKVDVADTTAGSQKFGKCGVSKDKKYLMSIGKVSGQKKGSFSSTQIYKTIFKNKCPHCGGGLVWDSGRSDTHCVFCGGYNGSKRTWGNISETEITCKKCCADYDAVTGYEKISNPKKKLTKIGSTVKSSKSEQDKLHNGKMIAVPTSNKEITPDELFSAITKLANKYKYKLGGSSSYTSMKKSGNGDCWAFSDLIFSELKKYGVSCKIVEYNTGVSSNHRSVLYKNEKNKWVDFPYRQYGWNKMLYNTSGSSKGKKINEYKGSNIGKIKTSSTKTSKTETITITTTKNYDKDKPFQGYLKITYSNTASFKAKQKTVYVKFTVSPNSNLSVGTGFKLYWVNNTIKKATLVNNDKPISIVDFIHQKYNSDEEVYLHRIQMIAPKKVATSENEDTDYYKYDKSTIDESSCKMRLYQIVFNDDKGSDSSELNSCGKSINSMLQDIVKDTGYYVNMSFGLHRKDDQINFRVNTATSESFTATEGNDNNILSWNSISYSPVSSLFNSSVQVFKDDLGDYHYVDTRDPNSILKYGEQTTLATSNEAISSSQAYFNARMNEKYNTEQTYTFTITVPNYPNLRIGDLVKVIANAKKLNTIKEVKSIKITSDYSKMPRIRTEIGLDELAPDIQLKKNIRDLRKEAKKETTSFSKSAIPVNDTDIYVWDR